MQLLPVHACTQKCLGTFGAGGFPCRFPFAHTDVRLIEPSSSTRKQNQKTRICKKGRAGRAGRALICLFLLLALCGSVRLSVALCGFCILLCVFRLLASVACSSWLLWLSALGFRGFLAYVSSGFCYFFCFRLLWFCVFFVVPYLPGEGLWILTKVQLIRILFSSSPPLLTYFCASLPNLISRAPDSIVPSTRTSYCEVRTLWAGPGPEQREWQNRCQIECRSICQKECQIEGQNKYAINTSRWYVRNYVTIVCKGGDDLK